MLEQPLARADAASTPAATTNSKSTRVTRHPHNTAHTLHTVCVHVARLQHTQHASQVTGLQVTIKFGLAEQKATETMART